MVFTIYIVEIKLNLDEENISIVVGQGWASEAFVNANLTKPKISLKLIEKSILAASIEPVSGFPDSRRDAYKLENQFNKL